MPYGLGAKASDASVARLRGAADGAAGIASRMMSARLNKIGAREKVAAGGAGEEWVPRLARSFIQKANAVTAGVLRGMSRNPRGLEGALPDELVPCL